LYVKSKKHTIYGIVTGEPEKAKGTTAGTPWGEHGNGKSGTGLIGASGKRWTKIRPNPISRPY